MIKKGDSGLISVIIIPKAQNIHMPKIHWNWQIHRVRTFSVSLSNWSIKKTITISNDKEDLKNPIKILI